MSHQHAPIKRYVYSYVVCLVVRAIIIRKWIRLLLWMLIDLVLTLYVLTSVAAAALVGVGRSSSKTIMT